MHFRVTGKRSKIRFIPANRAALRLIDDFIWRELVIQRILFCPVANNRRKTLAAPFFAPRYWKCHDLISLVDRNPYY
jgi:hypothetical protein